LASSSEIVLGDMGAQHVLIRPLSRSQPGLFDFRDGNWIDCEVVVAVGGFHGTFRADLRSEEFGTFLEEVQTLARTLEGIAAFTTMEGQIAITLTGDGRGHVRVSGEAIDDAGGAGNRLQFAYDLDQTYLQPVCESLESLLTAFPVMGSPDVEKIEGP
jgi:hypothetical protein